MEVIDSFKQTSCYIHTVENHTNRKKKLSIGYYLQDSVKLLCHFKYYNAEKSAKHLS